MTTELEKELEKLTDMTETHVENLGALVLACARVAVRDSEKKAEEESAEVRKKYWEKRKYLENQMKVLEAEIRRILGIDYTQDLMGALKKVPSSAIKHPDVDRDLEWARFQAWESENRETLALLPKDAISSHVWMARALYDNGNDGKRLPGYVNRSGTVMVPDHARKHLGLEEGGGVVFLVNSNSGKVEMLSDKQFTNMFEVTKDRD